MTTAILDPLAVQRVHAQERILRPGSWGDGRESVCLMHALVPFAAGVKDCEIAGWPSWLAHAIIELYDGDFHVRIDPGAGESPCPDLDSRRDASFAWSLDIAAAATRPTDYDVARGAFLLAVLNRCLSGDEDGVIAAIAGLWERRLRGENVDAALLQLHWPARDDRFKTPDGDRPIRWLAHYATHAQPTAQTMALSWARRLHMERAEQSVAADQTEARSEAAVAAEQWEYARQRADLAEALRAARGADGP